MDAVHQIGRRRGSPDTWLNEEAVPAIPRGKEGRARTVYGDRNLVVTAASAEHLLAMKVRATRPKDRKDIALLAKRLGLSSGGAVFDLHDEVFPHDPPKRRNLERARKILSDLWPQDRSLDRDDRYGYGPDGGRGSERHSRQGPPMFTLRSQQKGVPKDRAAALEHAVRCQFSRRRG